MILNELMIRYLVRLVACCFLIAVQALSEDAVVTSDPGPPQHCAEWSGAQCSWEPNLKPMTVDYGPVKETFYAYMTPDVATFYNKNTGSTVPLRSGFTGMYA